MKITDIVKRTNTLMGDGNTSTTDMLPYLDECVDQINEELGINLPLFTDVFENNFDQIAGEELFTYADSSADNEYTRIPAAYIRNFICNDVACRILSDEDEPFEVYQLKFVKAAKWFNRLVSVFSDFTLEDTEAITLNGDVDELEGVSENDTALGFYNPYAE